MYCKYYVTPALLLPLRCCSPASPSLNLGQLPARKFSWATWAACFFCVFMRDNVAASY